jgi:hypothetical protein
MGTPHDTTRRAEAGFGLLDALVGAAIVGVLIIAAAVTVENATKLNARYEQMSESEILRQYIKKNMDCGATFAAMAPGACGAPSTYVDVMGKDGHPMMKADQSARIGAYQVRASCVDAERQLLFEIRRLGPDGTTPGKDPVSGRPLAWSDPFHGIPTVVRMTGFADKLKFDGVPGSADADFEGKDIGDRETDGTLNNHFKKAYGVSFVPKVGGALRIARIAPSGGSDPKFDAWLSVKCSGKPNHNRL